MATDEPRRYMHPYFLLHFPYIGWLVGWSNPVRGLGECI